MFCAMRLHEFQTLARNVTGWLPDWCATLILLALSGVVATAAFRILIRILTRITANRDLFWRSLVVRGAAPLRLVILIVAFGFTVAIAPLTELEADILARLLTVGAIACIGWITYSALYIWTTIHMRRFRLDAEDNLMARKHITQSRILMRVAKILIVLVAIASMLMTFDAVRQYGVSLLASAGAAGIVAGLALQPVLKNLFAGIQLAITQPIRIDDAVIVEGEWGNVEEITSTYVVIRVWDWRRLIIPISYFIEKPFQNWTRENASLIGNVMLYLDHTTPVGRIRQEGDRIVRASPLWDGNVYNLAVTDFRERVMEVRVLMSARNAPRAFDLRCEVREKLIDFIQREMPECLPRTREDLRAEWAPMPAPQMERGHKDG